MRAGGKDELHQLVRNGLLQQFALHAFKRGHTTTDYVQWWAAVDPYYVKYTALYEPWFVVDRMLNPEYDVRFRGEFPPSLLPSLLLALPSAHSLQVMAPPIKF